MKIDPPLSKV